MKYRNFETAIYFNIFDYEQIKTVEKFDEVFSFLEKYIKIDKVYLETYRCSTFADREKLLAFMDYLKKKNVKTLGGIATVQRGKHIWEFKSFCFTNRENIEELKKIVSFTAALFDEIIIDDFYFTNCKCKSCQDQKGNDSWSEFRLNLLKEISENNVISVAKKINPNCKMTIKYPNWYEHYQGTGYNLKDGAELFDAVYTGTEVRDSQYSQQNMQPYSGYFLIRYLSNIAEGRNTGGWFDSLDCKNRFGTYMEQICITLFAKAKEVTLFSGGLLATTNKVFAAISGVVFDEVDKVLHFLGNPMGVACYKPYNSSGEDYIHSFIGMLGIPLEPYAEYPANAETVILTESAAYDTSLVELIKQSLNNGSTVIITSGLLTKLSSSGIEEIIEVTFSGRKTLVQTFACGMKECSFENYYDAKEKIMIPQLDFYTNDCWQDIVGINGYKNVPILLETKYGKGKMYVLTVPDNVSDLYLLPAGVINMIRQCVLENVNVRIGGPGGISLYLYDNETFIVQSFLPYNMDIKIIIKGMGIRLYDYEKKQYLFGAQLEEETVFRVNVKSTTYKVFKYDKM